ncbi:MAG: SDR family NAD(P)-dependent oxidoreductase [Pseudomonadota bacterium]
MEIQGNTAVITGGGNGIGRAIAIALAERGANVCVVDIEQAQAEAVAQAARQHGVRSAAYSLDVRDPQAVENLAETAWLEFGSVELLFNNAGVMGGAGPVWTASPEDVEWVLGVNVVGVMNGVRAFVPRMIASGAPSWIINTGSEHSFGRPHNNAHVYNASKHAVLGLSDMLRAELPDNVGVSVLCPGIVESTLWKASERRPDSLGGAIEANPAGSAAMQMGLPATTVADKVIEALEQEYFFILSHPHVAEIAARRADEVARAFAAQAPRYDGDDVYDVNKIIATLTARSQETSE